MYKQDKDKYNKPLESAGSLVNNSTFVMAMITAPLVYNDNHCFFENYEYEDCYRDFVSKMYLLWLIII